MVNMEPIYSAKNHRVERNARVYSVSLRLDKGSNYFNRYDLSSFFVYNVNLGIVEINGRLGFYVVMPNHVHLLIEVESYESLGRMFQRVNSGFSRFFRKRIQNKTMKRVFGEGPRYHAIHDMKQFFNCLKYLYDNPAKWNENPMKEKMKDVTEEYYGSATHELVNGTSKNFNSEALKEYTGFSDLNNLLALLRLPKPEFKKEVDRLLEKRNWSEEKDNRVFKLDPSKPWTNPWNPDDVCPEEVTEVEYNPKPKLEDLKDFVDK